MQDLERLCPKAFKEAEKAAWDLKASLDDSKRPDDILCSGIWDAFRSKPEHTPATPPRKSGISSIKYPELAKFSPSEKVEDAAKKMRAAFAARARQALQGPATMDPRTDDDLTAILLNNANLSDYILPTGTEIQNKETNPEQEKQELANVQKDRDKEKKNKRKIKDKGRRKGNNWRLWDREVADEA